MDHKLYFQYYNKQISKEINNSRVLNQNFGMLSQPENLIQKYDKNEKLV